MKNISLQQIECAVEIARVGSISKAARNKFLNQPNMSKLIKDLETTLGYQIFKRSSKGVILTENGETFLHYAEDILSSLHHITEQANSENDKHIRFSMAVPRATYITTSFSRYMQNIHDSEQIQIRYTETNNNDIIDSLIHNTCDLGIIRFPSDLWSYYEYMLHANNMNYYPMTRFRFHLLFSSQHPLASKSEITHADLENFLELAHPDVQAPTINHESAYSRDASKKTIFIRERGTQFDVLCKVPTSYMWVSPMPQETLDRYGLVQRECIDETITFTDLLIFHQRYMFPGYVKDFLQMLYDIIQGMEDFLETE